MKVARTLLAAKARPQDIPSNLGQIILIETEDDLWKWLLGWEKRPALEEFTFRDYLANFTLIICPRDAPKKRIRRLRREISQQIFTYPVEVVKEFPADNLNKTSKKGFLKQKFLRNLCHIACKLTKRNETPFELLSRHLKRCPFCEKESLEIIDQLAELKQTITQVHEEIIVCGFYGLILRCKSCGEDLSWQPKGHFYRVPTLKFC